MTDRAAHTEESSTAKTRISPTVQGPEGTDGPTRIALLTDVHGNLPAFEAVLADVDSSGVDAIWFLGDLVGYGAQPDECVQLAAERCDLCLAGNHDLGVLDRIDIGDFSPAAAKAALWTREHSSEETLAFLNALEPLQLGGPIGVYHASPRDPIWEYVLSDMQAEACMDVMPARVGAIGHSHVALRFTRANGGDVVGGQVEGGSILDLSRGDWLVNPGSVGQPRDGDSRAAWMLLDVQGWTGEWRRVEYSIDEAAQAIVDAGLPRSLGERLYLGQ